MPKVKKVDNCPKCGTSLVWLIQDPELKRIIHNVLHFGCPNCKAMFQCMIDYYSGEIKLDETREYNYDSFPKIGTNHKTVGYPKSRTKCPRCDQNMEQYIVDIPEIVGTTIFHCQHCKKVFDSALVFGELPSQSILQFSDKIQERINTVIKEVTIQQLLKNYSVDELMDILTKRIVELGNKPSSEKIVKDKVSEDYLNQELT